MADSLFFIKTGEAVAVRKDTGDTVLARMKSGDVFGESALQGSRNPRMATVRADGPVTTLQLSRIRFNELLGDLNEVLNANFNQKVLGGVEIFKALDNTEMGMLIQSLKEQRFEQGTQIITQGEPGDTFYVVKQGTVQVSIMGADGEVHVIKEAMASGEYFGERALIEEEPRNATVTVTSEFALCMTLTREDFGALIGPMNALLQREADKREREDQRALRPVIKQSELKSMGLLGVGAFGRVTLVVHEPTDTTYALKAIRKGQVIALKQEEHIMNEKNLLALCDHPFLLSLVATFQDDWEIYMLTELALGGELFSFLRARQRLDEDTARFYAACVGSAFSYMHDTHSMCYRDLKPENLMFDEKGYIKVVDFGFAKIVKERTFTLCGTPEYLAPEVIMSKGHNCSVDWWAFGILIYEMINGQPPFIADDPMDIYPLIIQNDLKFTPKFSKAAKQLISQLLISNPAERLGSLRQRSRDVICQQFFNAIDWPSLLARLLPAPYVPIIKNRTDTSNFDEVVEEDDEDYREYLQGNEHIFDGF
uniref:cGMP-dependent protein kinase n=1 Tax=Haptolina ericina TaxID=156174 RepID=A0A7S3FKY0_9EUKA